MSMIDAALFGLSGLDLFSFHQTVALVTIKGYKFFHARLLSFGEDFHQFNLMGGVALSYFHSGGSRNPVSFTYLGRRTCLRRSGYAQAGQVRHDQQSGLRSKPILCTVHGAPASSKG